MAKNAKLIIEEMATSELIPYIGNAKMHPEAQIAKIAGSIKEYGFNDPIAIDEDNGIIEGHGRLLAAQLLSMTKIPVIRLSHLSEAKRKAYIIAHNKITLDTAFDFEILQAELAKLEELGQDLESTGFDEAEIDEIMAGMNPEMEEAGNLELTDPFNVEEKYNFIIKCSTLNQLEMLQDKFQTSGKKVKFEDVDGIILL